MKNLINRQLEPYLKQKNITLEKAYYKYLFDLHYELTPSLNASLVRHKISFGNKLGKIL